MTVMASNLLTSNVLLRAGLDLSQYGVVIGIGMFVPGLANLVLAPAVHHLRLDRLILAVLPPLRVAASFLFLLLPAIIHDRQALTLAFSLLMPLWMIFAYLSNNSLAVLCKQYLPAQALGWHTGVLMVLFELPSRILAIPAGRYIDVHSKASDAHFYHATGAALIATGMFQLAGSAIILRLKKLSRHDSPPSAALRWRSMIDPFRDAGFRTFMNAIFVANVLLAMVGTFVFPYVKSALGWSLMNISWLELVLSALGIAVVPMWGKLADGFGGKRVLRFCVFGVAAGLLLLAGGRLIFVVLFALLAWQGISGFFGAGIVVAHRYLSLALSDPRRSNVYLAATAFVCGCGYMVGSIGGGWLLAWLQKLVNPAYSTAHYRIYFTCCALGFLILAQFVAALRDTHRHISSRNFALEVLRAMRGFAGRFG